jgi:uncharacterized protein DUF6644
MDHSAPAVFQALEASGFGAAIRQSIWLYPVANVGHVVAVVTFFAAVAVMDLRLLGAFSASPPGVVIRNARRAAVAAFMAVAVTGSMLFTAEASHLALNPVFQTKVILILLGLANVLLFEFFFGRRVAGYPPGAPLPAVARASATASLGLWLAVVACGRSIAYF